MTNLKKLGLTALAGSLVATSAFAGSLDVTGSAKVSYTSDGAAAAVNPWSMSRGITFSGAGELDNGMNVAVKMVTDTGSSTFSSSSLVLDMGDAGSVALLNGMSGGYGAGAYQDKMPTAGEEVWDDMAGEANGLLTMDSANTIAYGNAVSGINFSVNYNKNSDNDGSDKSIGLDYSPTDSLMIFAAASDQAGSATTTDKANAFGLTYTAMGATVGIQRTSVDDATADADTDRTHIAASFAVNENLSVSYGMSTVSFESGSKKDQEDSGFAASYTLGSMTFGASVNSSDNVGGTSGTDDTHKEMSVAFAF
jgi:outer membrane protein OmpU